MINSTKYMKIIFVIASDGFQQIEYHVPKRIVEKAGVKVITASDVDGGALAKDGSTAPVDLTLDQINIRDYDGIFFIGGPGALEHLDKPRSVELVCEAKKLHIPFGAICISVRILAKAGVLKGVKATGWDDDNALRTILEGYGAIYEEDKDIVTDGLIVTARGPASAEQFGQGIVRVLNKEILD